MLTRNAVRLSITCGVASQLEMLAMSAAECRSVLECAKNSPEDEISAAANHVARPLKLDGGGGGSRDKSDARPGVCDLQRQKSHFGPFPTE